jgi:hypothetical protein
MNGVNPKGVLLRKDFFQQPKFGGQMKRRFREAFRETALSQPPMPLYLSGIASSEAKLFDCQFGCK